MKITRYTLGLAAFTLLATATTNGLRAEDPAAETAAASQVTSNTQTLRTMKLPEGVPLKVARVGADGKVVPVTQGATVVAAANEAATSTAPAAPAAPSAAALTFENLKVDFGRVSDGEMVDIAFPVKNTSDRVVKIEGVHAGCGCTAVTDNPKQIAPGETSAIKVQFNSTGRTGKQTKMVTVMTDDPAQPQVRLTFEGLVVAPVFLTTTYLDMGEIQQGKEAKKEFSVITTDEPAVKVMEATVRDARLKVEKGATRAYNKGGVKGTEHVFNLIIPTDMPQGDINTQVSVQTNATRNPTLYLTARANVVGEFTFAPSRFFAVIAGDDAARTVTLSNRKGEAFKVLEMNTDLQIPVKLTSEEGANGATNINAVFSRGGQSRNETGAITVLVEDEAGKKSSIRIPAIVVVRETSQQTSSTAPTGAAYPNIKQ